MSPVPPATKIRRPLSADEGVVCSPFFKSTSRGHKERVLCIDLSQSRHVCGSECAHRTGSGIFEHLLGVEHAGYGGGDRRVRQTKTKGNLCAGLRFSLAKGLSKEVKRTGPFLNLFW